MAATRKSGEIGGMSIAKAYARRWSLLREIRRKELRAMTVDQKLQKMAALSESISAMGWEEHFKAQNEAFIRIWTELRGILLERG